MNNFINKTTSLGIGIGLRFLIALEISKRLSTDDASVVFIIMSLVQLLTIAERGRISAAKSRVVEQVITLNQYNYIHNHVSKHMMFFSILLYIILIFGSMILNMNLYVVTLGYIIGVLFLFNTRNQLGNEVRKKSEIYYWILNSYNVILYISINYLYTNLIPLILIITLILVFDILYNFRNSEKFNFEIIKSSKFKKIEILSIIIAAIELPVIYLVGGGQNVVAYVILSRMYNSVAVIYGQLTRSIWASGEIIRFSFGGMLKDININLYYMILFIILILNMPFIDYIFIRTEASLLMTLTLAVFSITQILNRFYKNKYLHSSQYEIVAERCFKFYAIYIFILVVISFTINNLEVFLFAKVLLSLCVFFENLKETRRVQ